MEKCVKRAIPVCVVILDSYKSILSMCTSTKNILNVQYHSLNNSCVCVYQNPMTITMLTYIDIRKKGIKIGDPSFSFINNRHPDTW